MTFNLEKFQADLLHLYLDFTHNFSSVTAFANYYGFSEDCSRQLIYHGGYIHALRLNKCKGEIENE